MKRINIGTVIGSTMAFFLLIPGASVSALDFELNEEDEVPIIVATPSDYGEKNIEQLFKTFSIRATDLRLDQLEEETIRSQAAGGGLSMAIAHVLTSPWPNDPNLTLKWNRMKFHIDSYNRSAVLDIVAEKTLNENGVQTSITYRWVIAINPGGLRTGRISSGEMNYKIYARGDQIEIISFEVDGAPVKYFLPDGSINRLAKIYSPNNDDCIEIDVRVEIDGDGTITSPSPDRLNFCAGSCSGYLLAATR